MLDLVPAPGSECTIIDRDGHDRSEEVWGLIHHSDMSGEGDQPGIGSSEEELHDEAIFEEVDLPDDVEGYSNRRVKLVQRADLAPGPELVGASTTPA